MVFVDGLTRDIKDGSNHQVAWLVSSSAQPLGIYCHLLYCTGLVAGTERRIRKIAADVKADKDNRGEEEPWTAFWSRFCGFELSVYHLHERTEFFQNGKQYENVKHWLQHKFIKKFYGNQTHPLACPHHCFEENENVFAKPALQSGDTGAFHNVFYDVGFKFAKYTCCWATLKMTFSVFVVADIKYLLWHSYDSFMCLFAKPLSR